MEKYGEVPKKFTKKWWEYFWDYYKWHTIAILFALMLVAVIVHQYTTQIRYDTTITVSGGHGLSEGLLEIVEVDLAEVAEDINGDGEKHVMIQQLISPPAAEGAPRDAQYEIAVATKVMAEFAAGESCVFFLSKDEVNKYLNDTRNDGVFVPVEEYAETMPDKSRLMSAKGIAYAVNLGACRYFTEKGIDASEYYLMIRNPRYNETDDEKAIKRTESAKKIAAYIIAE
ncbi:MAG: hypothetical protein UIM24_02115 [Clostridia bacterium]|nr:hypothetical protein [Clostridia bacterium]